MSELSPVLKIEDLEHKYFLGDQDFSVLNGISLSLFPGEIVGIMGVSGVGKSTLLSIAGLLLKPFKGAINILGENMIRKSDNQKSRFRLQNVGFVYQRHHLLADFNVRENVMMPLLLEGVETQSSMIFKAEKLLEELNLLKKEACLPSQLSVGECQRVAIARALVKFPKIIIADEPSSSLDVAHTKTVFSFLKDVVRRNQLSCLIATHDDQVALMADRVLFLRDGFLLEQR